jgi:hypothetical protein
VFVPLLDTHNGVVGPRASPQELTTSGVDHRGFSFLLIGHLVDYIEPGEALVLTIAVAHHAAVVAAPVGQCRGSRGRGSYRRTDATATVISRARTVTICCPSLTGMDIDTGISWMSGPEAGGNIPLKAGFAA